MLEYARRKQLLELETRLGYEFHNIELLNIALTHTSYVKGDGKGAKHNERLEFLGDAVLELCTSEYLFFKYKGLSEGQMTRLRAQAVCEAALFLVAREFNIGEAMLLGRGEEASGGRNKPSILADAVEAVIGAMYTDSGMEPAKMFVEKFIAKSVEAAKNGKAITDYKTKLQEYIQKAHIGQIAYEQCGSTGPDHNKLFRMRVTVSGVSMGEGEGRTKQEAGQQAARAALIQYGVISNTETR